MVRWVHAVDFVRVTASGHATAQEQFAAIRSAAQRSPAGKRVLFDGRDLTAEAASPTTAELRQYAERIAALGYRRFALVIAPPRVEISTTFARLCQEAGVESKVFRDLVHAKHWLVGHPPPGPEAP